MYQGHEYVTIDFGHRAWSLFRDGTTCPTIRGGDGPAPAAPAPTTGAPAPAPVVTAPTPVAGETDPATGKTFTQADVDGIATAQAARGERTATQKISDLLGMSPEDAKTKLDELNAANLAAMTEADRKKAEAEQATAAATARETAAAAREHDATLLGALLVAEVPAATASDVAKLLDVEVGADAAAIATAIEALKTRLPALFAAPAAGAPGAAPSGDAAGAARPPAGGAPNASSDALGKGKERAAKSNAARGLVSTGTASQ